MSAKTFSESTSVVTFSKFKLKSLFDSAYLWEYGDTVRNYLGDNFRRISPIFYHYYSSIDEVACNAETANLFVEDKSEDFVIFKKNN